MIVLFSACRSGKYAKEMTEIGGKTSEDRLLGKSGQAWDLYTRGQERYIDDVRGSNVTAWYLLGVSIVNCTLS